MGNQSSDLEHFNAINFQNNLKINVDLATFETHHNDKCLFTFKCLQELFPIDCLGLSVHGRSILPRPLFRFHL